MGVRGAHTHTSKTAVLSTLDNFFGEAIPSIPSVMGSLLLLSIKATENYMYKVMAFFKERRLPVILLGSKTGICLATGKLLR